MRPAVAADRRRWRIPRAEARAAPSWPIVHPAKVAAIRRRPIDDPPASSPSPAGLRSHRRSVIRRWIVSRAAEFRPLPEGFRQAESSW